MALAPPTLLLYLFPLLPVLCREEKEINRGEGATQIPDLEKESDS